jgi:hypothetical protein
LPQLVAAYDCSLDDAWYVTDSLSALDPPDALVRFWISFPTDLISISMLFQRIAAASFLLISLSTTVHAQVDEDAVRSFLEDGLMTFEMDGRLIWEIEYLPGGVILRISPNSPEEVMHPSVDYEGWRLDSSEGELQLVTRMSRNWEVRWDIEGDADAGYRFTTDADGALAVLRASDDRRRTNPEWLLGTWHLVSVNGESAFGENGVYSLSADGSASFSGISVPGLDASTETVEGAWIHSGRSWHMRDADGQNADAEIVVVTSGEPAERAAFIVHSLDGDRILMQPDRLPVTMELERR